MYSLKKIFKEIFRYKKEFIKGNLLAILATLVSIPLPLFIPLLIDEILLKKPGKLLPLINRYIGEGTPVYYILLTLAFVIFLRFVFFFLNMWQIKIFKNIGSRITYSIREKALFHIEKISLASYESVGSGTLTSYLVTDINTIDEFIGITVSRLLISTLTVVGVAIVLISIHPLLAFFIFVLRPLVSLLTMYLGKRVAVLKEKENSAFADFQENLLQTLELFVQIRAGNREKYYIERVLEKARVIRDTSIAFGYKSDIANRFSFLVFISGYEIFRAISIILVLVSSLSIGMMLAVFGYIWFIMGPIQEIMNIQYAAQNARMAVQRINQIFALQQEPRYIHQENSFVLNGKNSIELKNIFFSYHTPSQTLQTNKQGQQQERKFTLENISLKIPAGSCTAIVGASGSGKSTLAQVLVGFYPVNKGEILYNNTNVKKIGLNVVRQHVSLIVQNPMLFNADIEKNLTLGEAHSQTRIWQALEIAQIKDFVQELPLSLKTQVGKNGIRLSGGQKQRIAIARMILAQPSIVILDESTSALDIATETNLFSSLLDYLKEKTVIIIAHRLSTIRKADCVFVMENGKIVETGKPAQLAEDQGYYSNFLKQQN